jgi:alcohol dehydrogenase (cytochrome c)
VASGWGGAVPLWGGDVAKRVNFLEQGGSLWVFKIPKALLNAKAGGDATTVAKKGTAPAKQAAAVAPTKVTFKTIE